jgi:hypothetical protein
MRKLCLTLLVGLLLLPAAAVAGRAGAGDGSLVVTNASGRLAVSGHGLIFGHIDRGTVTVVGDYKPDNHSALPTVSGARLRVVGGNVVYSGSDMRFFFPGGRYTLVLDGAGIDASVVGRGKFSAVGEGLADDGTFTVDGGDPQSIDAVGGSIAFGGGRGAGGAAGFGNGGNGNGTGVSAGNGGRGKSS